MVLNATSVGVERRNKSFLCMCSRNCTFDIIWSEKTFWLILLKFDKWNVCLTLLKVDKKRRNYNPRKRLLRGVPWDYRFLNFKNITRDIMSRKSLVKYLSSIYIPALPSWFPAFSFWFLTFPPWFLAFPRWFPMFPPWFSAFPPWFPSFPTWFPHSHCDSLHSHHSPHSVPWFPLPAFTDSLFLQRAHSDSFREVACKYWNIFTDNQLS